MKTITSVTGKTQQYTDCMITVQGQEYPAKRIEINGNKEMVLILVSDTDVELDVPSSQWAVEGLLSVGRFVPAPFPGHVAAAATIPGSRFDRRRYDA